MTPWKMNSASTTSLKKSTMNNPNGPSLYTNKMKNREFDKEGPQNCCSEQATIVDRQGASENKNYEKYPTLSKTDSSSCSCIQTKISEGVLLVDKPRGKTSFSLVTALRRLTRIEKIG